MFNARILATTGFLLLGLSQPTANAQSTPGSSQAAPEARSVWIGPYKNVKVETADCGGKLCGRVIWATPEAEQEARDAGSQRLIGTELLQDYHQIAANEWEGRIFVPDMGRSFFSTIKRVDPSRIRISGCILGGFICKSQIWRKT